MCEPSANNPAAPDVARRRIARLLVFIVGALFLLPAAARIAEVSVTSVCAFAEGHAFATTGVYERVSGTRGPVVRGVAPPASRVPTLAAQTPVVADNRSFPAIPGLAVVRAGYVLGSFGDWVEPRPDPARGYAALVSTTDEDGNERAGIRPPDIAVPLATYTGWNLYERPFPERELYERGGSYRELAATRCERESAVDPPPSIEERYGTHAQYVNRVEAVVAELVRDRLPLEEDARAFVERARSPATERCFGR